MTTAVLKGTVATTEQMQREIAESHHRSRLYGVCSEERNADQVRLTPSELKERLNRNRDLLEVVTAHVDEFYNLLSPDDFITALADDEGYVLYLAGSDAIRAKYEERNFAPGFRWTEKDVGTTATSLCHHRQFPIQLNDRDHFCRRGHGFTSSAAPIFGHAGVLRGILVVSGSKDLVHPHTLIMVTAAARSIEEHMRLLRRNRELSLHIGFLDGVLDAAGTGILTLDRDMRIWKTNRKGRQILKRDDLEGKPLALLAGLELDLASISADPASWRGRECRLSHDNKDIHFFYSAQPVLAADKELLGAVLVFEEFMNLRKLSERISGTKPFFSFDLLIGSSPAFRQAIDLAQRAALSDSSVLLLGETGTGKELFAQAIHNAGARREQPFVPINCGAIPGELLESELFGYAEGAFTGTMKGGRPGKFELASGGTILLDEIGDMPHDMQVKLLRVLQTGEVRRIGGAKLIQTNARTIASTHVDLDRAIAEKRFRQDLFYRLNIIQIRIPPLRDRGPEDILALANHFATRTSPSTRIAQSAQDALIAYDWPGNVRELENTIQRALHLCEGGEVSLEHLGLQPKAKRSGTPYRGTLQQMEQNMIAAVLEETGANMAETAKILGISRATLYRKVKDCGL